jgi:hypothetical protein
MISMDKKYKYRNGEPARVLCVDRANSQMPVVSLTADGAITLHTKAGGYLVECEGDLDLIEVSPWDDFKIDEPVMVRNHDSHMWQGRHFAGVATSGSARAWENGLTSWTANGRTMNWQQCRRPTAQELGETK